jgi:dihydrofolate synthase / folylpolyglutamate synthase
MKIRSIDEAEKTLQPYVPLVALLTGKDTTFERIIPLMQLLENPQDRLRVIHIAGTSGKTSTAYYVSALLKSSGKLIGLTVSPHVDSITERIQINGLPLSDEEFCSLLSEFLDLIEIVEKKPSYFELLYAFSLWVFDKKQVDYAVVETGMGGLHDATNIVTREDKICVITDIGFDHMHILGHTLSEIAKQKIGIAHTGNQVYMFLQNQEIMGVISEFVLKVHASLHVLNENEVQAYVAIDLSELPEYQKRNWLLAHSVVLEVLKRDGLQPLSHQALAGSLKTYIPGRMDIRHVGELTIVMDGAHNAQKMETFVRSFQLKYPNERPAVLLAMKEGKDHAEVVPILSKLAGEIILTQFHTSQDLPAKSIDSRILADEFKTHNDSLSVSNIPDLNDAYTALLQAKTKIVIITGSFYLLSQIRKIKA